MQNNTWLYVGGGVLLLLLLSNKANAKNVNLDLLTGRFDADDIDRLQKVQNALAQRGLSTQQIKMLLSQVLQETGIFTASNANYHATDQLNNYAGISNANGSLRSYNTIDDFVTDYLRVLNLPSHYPIQAVDIVDFNNRLKANGYYTDNKNTYGNNLNYYYNLLP